MNTDANLPSESSRVPFKDMAAVFTYLGLFSFGGGLVAWIFREIVEKRRWVSDHEFFSGVALGQVMPGTNMINLVIHLGYLLRGARGACVAFLSFVVLPTCFLTALYALTEQIQETPLAHFILSGIAAVGVGLSIGAALKALRRSGRAPAVVVVTAIFTSIAIFDVSMLLVVFVAAPLSVLLAFKGYYD
jgi:chromate transporter